MDAKPPANRPVAAVLFWLSALVLGSVAFVPVAFLIALWGWGAYGDGAGTPALDLQFSATTFAVLGAYHFLVGIVGARAAAKRRVVTKPWWLASLIASATTWILVGILMLWPPMFVAAALCSTALLIAGQYRGSRRTLRAAQQDAPPI